MKTPEEAAEVIGREVFTRKLNECRDPYDGSLCGQDRTLEAMEFGMRESFLAGVAWRDENPPWVSVKTRLPEDDQEVLISWMSETVSGKTFRTYDVARYSAAQNSFSGWRHCNAVIEWLPFKGPKGES